MKKPNSATAGSSKTKFEEESEEEENETTSVTSSEEEEEIERELAEITFEDLLKARSDGSHLVYRKNSQEKKAGRANKNRPMEVSAKKPVSRFREVVQAPKRVCFIFHIALLNYRLYKCWLLVTCQQKYCN